jgi:hypothetical protein
MDNARFINRVKGYLLVRWKKRWPGIPVAAIVALFCSWTKAAQNKNDTRGCVLGAVIFVIVGILFPFRWGGEDWNDKKPER